jgi:hypothetical protein
MDNRRIHAFGFPIRSKCIPSGLDSLKPAVPFYGFEDSVAFHAVAFHGFEDAVPLYGIEDSLALHGFEDSVPFHGFEDSVAF